MTRQALATLLVVLVSAPPVSVAPSLGVIEGTVSVEGRALSGVRLALIEIESGAVSRVESDASGAFALRVAPGLYALTAESPSGLVVGHSPAIVPVAAGQVASAQVELLALPVSGLQGAPGSGELVVEHTPVDCFVEGEHPLLSASVEPAASVAWARVYFRAAHGTEFFYVEMEAVTDGFEGKLPRPRIEASPIDYYIQARATDDGEGRVPEHSTIVVEDAEECEGKVAVIGS